MVWLERFRSAGEAGRQALREEGPWWGQLYRRASTMDMLCYVSFKNLLIGAVLFIGLKGAGILQI